MHLPVRALNMTFFLWFIPVALGTFLLHEFAHWSCGTALGYEMTFRLNGVTALSAVAPADQMLVDMAGPAITLLQGIFAWAIVRRNGARLAFAILYFAAFMRIVAFGISFIYSNDEARISLAMGLPFWLVPLLVSSVLVVLLWQASRRIGTTWSDQIICYLAASLALSAVVGIDRFVF